MKAIKPFKCEINVRIQTLRKNFLRGSMAEIDTEFFLENLSSFILHPDFELKKDTKIAIGAYLQDQ